MTDLLRIEDLSAGYGPLAVLHSVSMSVRRGERIGIVGLNGHGKSTLLRAIAGLTGWQSGSISLAGVEIGGKRSNGPGRYTHRIVRMGLALMPQGDALFHGLTVADHQHQGSRPADCLRSHAGYVTSARRLTRCSTSSAP